MDAADVGGRKLASVVKILDVQPIEGADRIECVSLLGWQAVTEKGRFKAGDLAVYLEVDSVPPDVAAFRWLWTKKPFNAYADAKPGIKVIHVHTGETGEVTSLRTGPASDPALAAQGFSEVFGVTVRFGDAEREVEPEVLGHPRPGNFRVKTMKLRGCLSQGVLMRFEELGLPGDLPEGEDVTARLGVEKYEPPEAGESGVMRRPFPDGVSKTDETRIQSSPGILERFRGKPYVATLKVDGTSSTFFWSPEDGLHCCSKNIDVVEGDNEYWEVGRKTGMAEILARNPGHVVQGEIAGPGVQGNKLGLKSRELFVFTVYKTAENGEKVVLTHEEAQAFCASNNLQTVPVVFEGDSFDETIPSLLLKAEGKYEGTKNEREGLVFRLKHEPAREYGVRGKSSFKVISNAFLLKGGT